MTAPANPSLRFGKRGTLVQFWFDGAACEAHAGETVAVALLAAGIRGFSRNKADGSARGLFCAMGICQDCIVLIDGRATEACRTLVEPGMDVRSGG